MDLFAGGATLLFTVAFVAFNYAFHVPRGAFTRLAFGNGGAEPDTAATSGARKAVAGALWVVDGVPTERELPGGALVGGAPGGETPRVAIHRRRARACSYYIILFFLLSE